MATRTDAPVSLEAGDNLTREEFHRRYCARPDIKKAELIDGVVYVPSPLRIDRHAEPHLFVVLWLGTYARLRTEARRRRQRHGPPAGGDEVQPDAFLWRPEAAGRT